MAVLPHAALGHSDAALANGELDYCNRTSRRNQARRGWYRLRSGHIRFDQYPNLADKAKNRQPTATALPLVRSVQEPPVKVNLRLHEAWGLTPQRRALGSHHRICGSRPLDCAVWTGSMEVQQAKSVFEADKRTPLPTEVRRDAMENAPLAGGGVVTWLAAVKRHPAWRPQATDGVDPNGQGNCVARNAPRLLRAMPPRRWRGRIHGRLITGIRERGSYNAPALVRHAHCLGRCALRLDILDRVDWLRRRALSLTPSHAASHEATSCCVSFGGAGKGRMTPEPGRGEKLATADREGKLVAYLLLPTSRNGRGAMGSAAGGIPRSAVPGAVLLCKHRRNRWPRTLALNRLSWAGWPGRHIALGREFWNTQQSAIALALDRTGQGGRGH